MQARIDGNYAEWRKSRSKLKTQRGRWYDVIVKLCRRDTYRYAPKMPLSDKELLDLRAALHSSRATCMFRWSVRRDGDAVDPKNRDVVKCGRNKVTGLIVKGTTALFFEGANPGRDAALDIVNRFKMGTPVRPR